MFNQRLTPYYDDPQYDYKKYWGERQYENKSEEMALSRLLTLVKNKNVIADIGAGFGRLTPIYAPLFKTSILIDPSQKLLAQAKKLIKRFPNLVLLKAYAEKIPLKDESVDVAIIIRTLHHLKNPLIIFKEVRRIIKPGGSLILEFANKIHFKNCLKALLTGNFSYFNKKPEDISSKEGCAPFINYHPQYINTLLFTNNFRVIKRLSVSNLRHRVFKKIVPLSFLLSVEKRLQTQASRFCFGPSIFVLAQKN